MIGSLLDSFRECDLYPTPTPSLYKVHVGGGGGGTLHKRDHNLSFQVVVVLDIPVVEQATQK